MTMKPRFLLSVLTCAIGWSAPAVFAQATNAGVPVPLTSLPVLKNAESDNLDRGLFADRSPEGAPVPLGNFAAAAESGRGYLEYDLRKRGPLTLGKRTYQHGLMALHGSVSWSYTLGGQYAGLSAEVGNFTSGGGTLSVFGDGRLLHCTDRLPNDSALPLLVDLRGVQEMKMVWADMGDKANSYSVYNATIVIGNPTLTLDPRPGLAPTTGPSAANRIPTARITAQPTAGPAPLEVVFTGDRSTDSDGQINRYTWHFGDGAIEHLEPNPRHTFTEPGLYHVVMLAEDARGGVGITSLVVTVRPPFNQPPIASLYTSARVLAPGTAVRMDASASTDLDGRVVTFAWDFGDGQTAEGPVAQHVFAKPGRFDVTLTLTDDQGATTTKKTSLRVATTEQLARPFPLQKGARILVLGNSLTSFNGTIKDWLMVMDERGPEPLGLVAEGIGKGMGKLVEYATWDRLGVQAKIDQGWDIVIIQPWIESHDPKVSEEELLKDASTLVGWVRASGAFPVFYEPQFGWLSGFTADQKLAHERIRMLADKLDTGFIPAGQAWVAVEKDYPLPRYADSGRAISNNDPKSFSNLLFSDGGHQNFTGALFNSMMVWRYLTGHAPSELRLDMQIKFNPEFLKQTNWELLPYLQNQAAAAITPAADQIR